MVKSGAIGTPQIVRISSRDPQPPPVEYVKVSGGLFLDMMIHDFDMARFLVGEVTEIMATGNCLVDPAIGHRPVMSILRCIAEMPVALWVQLIIAGRQFTVMTNGSRSLVPRVHRGRK